MSRARKTSAKAKDEVAPRFANNGYRLPDPLPNGEILVDKTKNEWIIGESIGCGGFGEIYLAKRCTDSSDNWDNVIKVDNYNGPLFAEIHFYQRVAKADEIEKWMQKQGLTFLGIPRYIASGIHDRPGKKPISARLRKTKAAKAHDEEMPKFRFLVMQRFGTDLQNILNSHGNAFTVKTAYTLAIKIIDILQYIHSYGYIHADVKASNLLIGMNSRRKKASKDYQEIYLVDYGLVDRFMTREGQHRVYEEDIRRAHNGTVEFASRDAHIGALSRRSDLEILAYNVLSWLSGGRLPWMSNLKDHSYVKECKEYYMKKIHELVNYSFSSSESKADVRRMPLTESKSVVDRKKVSVNVPAGIVEVFQYIANLEFNEEPDYHLLKKIFENGLEKSGETYDGTFYFDSSSRRSSSRTRKSAEKVVVQKRSRSKVNTNDMGDGINNNTEEETSPPKKNKAAETRIPKVKRASRMKKAVSAPTTLTPSKTSTEPSPRKGVLDNPTPAMIEMLKKMNAKKLKAKR